MRVLDGDIEVARHSRSWGVRQQVEDEAHLAALLVDKRKSREHRGAIGCSRAAQPPSRFLEKLPNTAATWVAPPAACFACSTSMARPRLDVALTRRPSPRRLRRSVCRSRARPAASGPRCTGAHRDHTAQRPARTRPRRHASFARAVRPTRPIQRSRRKEGETVTERDLRARLRALGLSATADGLDDLVALASKKRWGCGRVVRARRNARRERPHSARPRASPQTKSPRAIQTHGRL